MNFNEKATQQRKKAFADNNINRRGRMKSAHSIILLVAILLIFYMIGGFTIGFVQALYHRTPDVTVDNIKPYGDSSLILDDQDKTIAVLDSSYYSHEPVSIQDIPEHLQDAVVSSIDPDFYDHYGVTVYTVINTLINSFVDQDLYGGCSLITEKLLEDNNPEFVKDSNWISRLEYHLSLHFQALSLERNCSKAEILESFLNNSSFGNGIIGVQSASLYYFGKDVVDLNLSESVMLGTILSDPYANDPYEHQQAAISQYLSTLAIMQDKAFITEAEWTKASSDNPLKNLQNYSDATVLSAFEQAVISSLAEEFYTEYHVGATKFHNLMGYGNLRIHTTQNTDLQKKVQSILDSTSQYSYSAQNAEVSMTMMEPVTGEVKVIIGGKQGKTATVNRATRMTRQPGTIFQALATYLPGLDTGTLTLASVYEDAAYHYLDNHRTVHSIDNVYDGLTTIREALGQQMNLVAARAQSDVTSQTSFDYLINLGFEHIVESSVDSSGNMITDVQQSICNGNLINGVTNLEVTHAMCALANRGTQADPILYTSVTDDHDRMIFAHKPVTKRVIQESTAFLISDALKDNSSNLFKNVDIAEITGNNDENTDFWCTGYSRELSATLWIGYDDNRSFEADKSAKMLWEHIMKMAIDPDMKSHFTRPGSVFIKDICQESGMIAVPGICDHDPRGNRILTEYFTNNTIPTTTCNTHVEVTICPSSGKLINNYCPKENYLRRVYLVLPKGSENTLDYRYALPDKYKNGKRCNIHNVIR